VFQGDVFIGCTTTRVVHNHFLYHNNNLIINKLQQIKGVS